MRISAGGAASIQSLEGSEAMLGASSLKAAAALMTSGFDHLQLAVKCVYLSRNVEDTSVCLVVVGDLSCQSPIVRATGQLGGLMVGRCLPGDGVDEPHREWLSGGALNVRGGGEQVILENGVAVVAEGAEGAGDWSIAQFDVPGLSHDAIGVRDGEVGEAAVILFKAFRALRVGLARHLSA